MKRSQFIFNPYPYRYIAQYTGEQWVEQLEELPNKGAEVERTLPQDELYTLLQSRNYSNELPLVNYTTQYGMGCFEGIKAYTQVDESIGLFRVEANATRFYNSMEGLYMPPFPKDMFIAGINSILTKSLALGYYPKYNPEWEQDNFLSAKGIYIRPFTYSEAGFGVNLSEMPYVIIVATEVGSYFDIETCPTILVTDKIRATPNGTGWIKCASNYVIPSLAKNSAIKQGYTECLFLDSQHHKYVEECSSCNIFFVLQDNTVVTPVLNDTILPGITRDSIITLLKDNGYSVEEREISIEEVFDSAIECFSTGTAVGVSHFGKLTYNDTVLTFGDGSIGPISAKFQKLLKHIQHGKAQDSHSWITTIPVSN